ncbi:hypothetical protein U9M48_041205 [Paspalum notatum var. saurae]|uniref:Uncharacterized protein n=1 Tax=Paspalum notatum var. saurae TaxID=547442 RepID=A0AAQ3UTZ5_PASNO
METKEKQLAGRRTRNNSDKEKDLSRPRSAGDTLYLRTLHLPGGVASKSSRGGGPHGGAVSKSDRGGARRHRKRKGGNTPEQVQRPTSRRMQLQADPMEGVKGRRCPRER